MHYEGRFRSFCIFKRQRYPYCYEKETLFFLDYEYILEEHPTDKLLPHHAFSLHSPFSFQKI